MRRIADKVGVDPWDVRLTEVRMVVRVGEGRAKSRFWFGSPCRFVRWIDVIIHVWVPCLLEERYPKVASRLRVTSPRWGALHRRVG